MPIIKFHNIETGEVIEREMTPEELATLRQLQASEQNLDSQE